MATDKRSRAELLAGIKELSSRLEEAEETLQAIGSGAVDAFVVSTPEGEQVFTLKGAEHPYRVLIESMSEGAVTLARDGTVMYCNSGLARMLDVPMEKLTGSRFISYVAPADSSTFEFMLKKCLRKASKGEIELMTTSGRPLPVILSCSNVDEGEVQGFCLVVTDLSEQKRAEEIMAAEELARSILDQAGEAIVVCDEHGRIIRSSRQAQQICGKDLPLRQFDELLPLQMVGSGRFFSIGAPLKGEIFGNVEVVLEQSDRTCHLLLNATPLKNAANKIFGSVVTLTDITQRKRAEQELHEVNRELEAFNYTVAHDLRKPLTVINGYAQALMELYSHLLDEQGKSYLQEAYEGTLRMNRLIDALLNFSRAAHAEPKRKSVNMCSLCEEVASELKLAEPARQVTFRIPGGIVAEADPDLLRILLSNLFGNAWKYTSKRDEGIIEFGATESDGHPTYFVRDNGFGFDPAKADKLFAPFQRLESGEEVGGLGIGLATVDKVTRRHGGGVWAEAEPGKGATFYFTLG